MDSNGRLKDSALLKRDLVRAKSEKADELYRMGGVKSRSENDLPDTSRREGVGASGKGRGKGKGDLGTQIGFQLRNLYDDVLNQPVPDRFLDLLGQLEATPRSSLKD
ncbi:MAG: hypothetical protein NVSMB26_27310 [Beijerinckiaceae bacterium]